MKRVKTGGGWPAIRYSLKKMREAGGPISFWRAMRSRNACKTCALGMGGQRGGMVNEQGHFPEVCKKSMQAMTADMQGAIPTQFWSRYGIKELRAMSPRQLEHVGRLVQPVRYCQGDAGYQPISWDEAFQAITNKLAGQSAEKSFWYFSGRSSNEAGFLLQLFARLYGTNNVNNCSYYCHQASGVGLTSVTGSGTATIQVEDLEEADCVFLIGGNPASNHPRLMTTLKNLRRRGGEVIVINPMVETGLVNFSVPSDPWSLLFGSKIASLYVQPHIGGDLALLAGLQKELIERGAVAEKFLSEATSGWEDVHVSIINTSWDEITSKSGVSREQIKQITDRYVQSKRSVFAWTMGITHHAHGVQNVQAIANLALMRGMVGRKGAGLLPIRGHSNVQGIGSVGVTPKLKQAIFDRIENELNLKLPTSTGLDTLACMDGAASGELSTGFCLGGNLYGSNPDASYAAKALQNLDQVVYLSTTLNTGHAFGNAKETIILPVLARDEEPSPTTQESMFNFVRLSDGGPARHSGPKSEIEVIATVAKQVNEQVGKSNPSLSSLDWDSMRETNELRSAIAKVVPGYGAIKNIADSKEEFQIDGRTFHTPKFATEDGRANLHAHDLPELAGLAEDELRVMTIRSEGQFNTVVYEDDDLYRGVSGRYVILMHEEDLKRFNLADGDHVRIVGPAGEMRQVIATKHNDIRAGNAAMYYPEANVLVDRGVDPKSRTPAFKGLVVKIEKEVT